MPAVLRWPFRPVEAPAELILLACSAFWALACNGAFLRAAGGLGALATVAFVVALAALHFVIVAPFAWRPVLRPLLTLLLLTSAFSVYYMERYGIVLDPSMLRNVLRTDWHEANELLTWSLLPHLLLYAVLPLAVLWHLRPVRLPWGRALLRRALALAAGAAVLVGAVMAAYQPLASLMRNQKESRYLITPANVVWSLASTLKTDVRAAAGPRTPIGQDARPGPRMAARTKPLVVVLVVGETARAANWGLNPGARATTPELAKLPVVNFPDVSSCGTNTEVSLPCMFAPVGRRDYDEARIRGSETLLHVLARAGVQVSWRDNQSGCKGVCDGLPAEQVSDLNPPGLCGEGRCLDEGLLYRLDERLAQASGTQLWVLHMLGNHGPAYFKRYPPAFDRFKPACQNEDLKQCTQEQITNAYDNALLYTDHVLATLIGRLQAASSRVDSAMLYVSDHGESLGEHGLYLHGLPYPIAPDVQKRVPMVAWLSPGYPAASGIGADCLRQRAAAPASHDHLFHTLLSMLDVKTSLHEPEWDLVRDCPAP